MLASQIPTRVEVPFGETGLRNTVPVAASSTPGVASYTTGFPSICFQPIAAGGIPPLGQDFNGILYAITSWDMWQSAGGVVGYDAAFSAAVGGYPKGAMIAVAGVPGAFWVSLADNNTTDPDTGGADWVFLPPDSWSTALWADTGTVNALVITPLPAPTSIRPGTTFQVQVAHTNTGAVTLNAGFGATAVTDTNGTALPAGALSAGGVYPMTYDGSKYQVGVPAATVVASLATTFQQMTPAFAVATGTANTYSATFSPAISVAPSGTLVLYVKIPATNTGSSTLDAGFGARAIVGPDGNALPANYLSAGQVAQLQWSGTNWQLVSALPASVALLGVPTVPTAAADTDTQQAASCAFVLGQAGTANPSGNGSAAPGTSLRYARQDHVHPTDTSLVSKTNSNTISAANTYNGANNFTGGSITVPTQPLNTSNTTAASTAFANPSSSLSSPGWYELPSGWIINTGSIATTSTGAVTITFAKPFPVAPVSMFITIGNLTPGGGNPVAALGWSNLTQNSVTVYSVNPINGALLPSVGFSWEAKGF